MHDQRLTRSRVAKKEESYSLLVPTTGITTQSDWPLRRGLRKPYRFYGNTLEAHLIKITLRVLYLTPQLLC
jgi:hypothetical protein